MQEKAVDICQETCVHPDAVQKAKSGELGLDLVQQLADVFKVLGIVPGCASFWPFAAASCAFAI